MPMSPTIWTEIWRRVREREELGLFLRFSNNDQARSVLYRHRPPEMCEYTIARVQNPDAILIVAPSVDLDAELNHTSLSLVVSDIT